MAEFEVNRAGLVNLLRGRDGAAWYLVYRASNAVRNKARDLAPVNQGGLRGSITVQMRNEDGPVGYVGSNLKYAVYVHEGTGIYAKRNPKMIVPVRKRVLRWPSVNNSGRGRRRYQGGGTAGYVYSMKSKGMRGRPFLRQALIAVLGKASR